MTDRLEEIRAGLDDIVGRMDLGDEQAVSGDVRLRGDLGLDSIRMIELLVEVENRFEVRLEPEDEAEIESLDDLARVIARRRACAEADPPEAEGHADG